MIKNQTIRLGDSTIEYTLKGEGDTSIVFVNGFRMPMQNWDRLYPEIEKYGKVFSYNRPGVGKSTKATCDQTGMVVVETLKTLLKAVNIPPPYIFIGHSLGGLFINLYARLYPEEVAAIIFVDATHPDEPKRQNELQPQNFLQGINNGLKLIERAFDKYKYSEDERISETIHQIKSTGDFPAIPMAVVTGTKKMPFVPEENFKIHLQCQKELLALSSYSKQYCAEQSGHFPQITEPEIVLTVIKETVNSVKSA